jgi:hypothetical protein
VALLFRAGPAANTTRQLSEATWTIGLSAALGYPIAIVFGIPLYVFLKWRGWTGLLLYMVAGALLGLTIYLIWVLLAEYSSSGLSSLATKFSNTALVQIPLAMFCGAVATLFFWFIARPDQ